MQALDESKGEISCARRFKEKQLGRFCNPHDTAGCEICKECEKHVLHRIRIWNIPRELGMGPAHQRGLLNEVRDFEDPEALCLSSDSHMDFHKDWDTLMITEWVGLGNEFAVVTAYPMRMMPAQDTVFAHSHVDLCGYFLENGIPRGQGGDNLLSPPQQKPYLTFNWAAGFSFSRCHADRNVPVDKYLRYIFTGEEVDRSVRLWTHGYDLYMPAFTYIYHDYDHAKQDFWHVEHDQRMQVMSRQRLGQKLQLGTDVWDGQHRDLGIYGLGTQRTLEQYVAWARLRLGTKDWDDFLSVRDLKPVQADNSVNGVHWFCQTLKRVPVRDTQSLYASIREGGLPRSNERFVPSWEPDAAGSLPVLYLNSSAFPADFE